jgi:hypothetical protein
MQKTKKLSPAAHHFSKGFPPELKENCQKLKTGLCTECGGMFLYSGRLPRKHKCLKKEQLEVRVNIRDALQETLNKQTLKEWLIDNAEDVIERSRPGFHEEEVDSTTVCVDGDNFLVRFTMPRTVETKETT